MLGEMKHYASNICLSKDNLEMIPNLDEAHIGKGP